VRSEAAQLADWEEPPQLPEMVPIGAEALKLMMRDIERMLGAVMCIHAEDYAENSPTATPTATLNPEPQSLQDYKAEHERLTAELDQEKARASSEAASYRRLIAQLQTQLSEMRSEYDEAERRRLMGGSVETMLDDELNVGNARRLTLTGPAGRRVSKATESRRNSAGGGRPVRLKRDSIQASLHEEPDSLDKVFENEDADDASVAGSEVSEQRFDAKETLEALRTPNKDLVRPSLGQSAAGHALKAAMA